ncbi:hypothetical protein RJ640_008726 [Escallonia rubra]|uniref:Nuclear pore complex protein NUP160 n=1 Tax=Escallonia rubra TaxID=112253 RepID=A0AA88UC77_9ASTE|nr:hypothetical protein RJ640_008726 [Escallonia rubra]
MSEKMRARSSLAGIEVPVIGSDTVKWHQVAVPSTSAALPPPQPFAPSTEDAASCSIVGSPPTYFIWRIHKIHPRVLEIVAFCGYKEFPRIGLRVEFPDALSPFAVICENKTNNPSGNPYMLYAVTVSGVAYLIRLKNVDNYASCSIFEPNEVIEFNLQTYPHYGAITAMAAISECLVIGGNDGSVGCFQLGMLDPSAPGFLHELRDDAGFGRLWGLVSRSRVVAAVHDMVISCVARKKLLFVLHSDGILRDSSMEMISISILHFTLGDRIVFSLEPSMQDISLEEGGVIDVNLTSNKIWILKEDGMVMQELFGPKENRGVAQCYALQEAFVADQLFQSSEHSSDDLLWLAHSLFSSSKDQIAPFLSSIFLRKLLLPGVHHNTVLRATLQDYNKHLTDSEFYSLTGDGLKEEILSVIEHEGVSGKPISVLYCWKTFCTRYFHNWCKISAPRGLLIDSSAGAIGIIRNNSISLFRCLEDIELLTFGSFDEIGDIVSSGSDSSDDDLERDILFEVLHCIGNVSQQLGKAAAAVFYESLGASNISSEEVVPCLLKILETGYSSSIAALHISELGADTAWEKEVADHKNHRKFSTCMFLSLHALCSKATTWAKVLDVIESYLKFLVPRKLVQNLDSAAAFNISSSITVEATSQVAKVMFESALDVLLLLGYLANISGQIHMLHNDVSRIKVELVPMIQEVVTEWHIIHFFGTTPSEQPAVEDFSSQLSSLQIDSDAGKKSWNEKVGKCDFTLAFILFLNSQSSSEDQSHLAFGSLPDPGSLINSVRDFTSWMIWGQTGEESPAFFSHSTELALILLKHGQCDAVEDEYTETSFCLFWKYLLSIVDAHIRKEKTSGSIQSVDGQWTKLLHLLGCCLLAQAQRGLNGMLKQRKMSEAVRCFFRAVSAPGASEALRSLSSEAGLPYLGFNACTSAAAWKLQYYQWAMQIFEQYNMIEGACQFALAALEQVDEALCPEDADHLFESTTTVKGRLWANLFKFTLDHNNFYDAYCAIISNPDEESKSICLRRFIIVLYERGPVKVLCDGQLPFTGIADKVEQELAWKACILILRRISAGRLDVSAEPNPFKLLYSFEMHRHNWRRAASYIYLYSTQLRTEAAVKDHHGRSLALQERLNGLSAAINALHLVHPAYAWINPSLEENPLHKENYPTADANAPPQDYVSAEILDNEFVLTSAEHLLSLLNIKWTSNGNVKPPPELVDLLVQSNLYDMAFTVLLKFWKGSGLTRELERVFAAMSLKCCSSRASPALAGSDVRAHGLLLTSSNDEAVAHDSLDIGRSTQQYKGNSQWGALEVYLEKYRRFHPRLPVTVAETLLCADPQIELPLWLVHMFKCVPRESCWGMAGNELNPSSLFQLYVDYGRYAEATNLLLEYIESFASMRPTDIIRRKRAGAVWFPYTTIERLWCKLEESIRSGHRIEQCEKLKKLIHGALVNHLNQLKVDSDDVLSSATC